MKLSNNQEHDFLFQKLGNTWFVFGEMQGELIYTALPEGIDPKSTKMELFEVIENHIADVAKVKKSRKDGEVAA